MKKKVTFVLTEDLYDELMYRAKADEVSISRYVCDALEFYCHKDINFNNELVGLLASVNKGVSDIEKTLDVDFSLFSFFLTYYFALNETSQSMSNPDFQADKIEALMKMGERKRDFFMDEFKQHLGDTKTKLREILVADYLFQKVQKEENND